MASGPRIRAWRPEVPGLAEVLHGHFPRHAYPAHTHDTWTVLLVDEGTVRYDLGRHERATARARVTVLPPHVAHDGRSVEAGGFRKRVLYLDADRLDAERVGRWVDDPDVSDPVLWRAVDRVHRVLAHPGDELAAESGIALLGERLGRHAARVAPVAEARAAGLARRMRESARRAGGRGDHPRGGGARAGCGPGVPGPGVRGRGRRAPAPLPRRAPDRRRPPGPAARGAAR
ncbi:AraC family ligand binding domain-containing protein [Nocardioides convexus]|uniref:AraC family ligand binding domain-containing protein n=1 Tax=Nocardioides convexus TaxID=2712224 RepID=UPI0024183F81|nr:AraC family ligand binding domain-containing protein [Nocardioides convexus]